ncbi:hypothetical protein OS493_011222 [Desmophyllum pertusum]|uniref:Uncharacterized protein n=1 Tax=Desmophyllum pertusum TaxID=174260 RepID=A0A9X0CS96_9CNID|nr:hypothetical protein OS493_011222 [Desmophyllum pertusum]
MNQATLFIASLAFFALPSALGIICKKCTPDIIKFTTCNKPDQMVDMDCDNETLPANIPANMSQGVKYDACAVTTIVAVASGTPVTTYVMSCAIKTNSSDPSVVNCSSTEDYICGDARNKAASDSRISVDSCNSVCCASKACNVLPTTAPPVTTTDTTTASTTSGVREVQPPRFGLLLVFLAISVVFKKVDDIL